jgi:hypothetical protein
MVFLGPTGLPRPIGWAGPWWSRWPCSTRSRSPRCSLGPRVNALGCPSFIERR